MNSPGFEIKIMVLNDSERAKSLGRDCIDLNEYEFSEKLKKDQKGFK